VSDNRKTAVPPKPASPNERRRVGTIVHDDRGNASVEWHAAAADEERPVLEVLGEGRGNTSVERHAASVDKEQSVLEVLGEGRLTLKSEEISYDPYSSNRTRQRGSGKRTDLRKLSEWIKKMRELEERKRNGGDENGE
jgi:hypothetical protein